MHLADQIILKGKTIGDRTTFTIWTEPEDKYRLKSLKGECWINPRKQIEALSLQSDLIKDKRSLKKKKICVGIIAYNSDRTWERKWVLRPEKGISS